MDVGACVRRRLKLAPDGARILPSMFPERSPARERNRRRRKVDELCSSSLDSHEPCAWWFHLLMGAGDSRSSRRLFRRELHRAWMSGAALKIGSVEVEALASSGGQTA
eukprot:gene7789-biopygen5463